MRLNRLAGTRIKTNVATGDEISTQNFGLIEWYDYNRKGSGMSERLRYLDVKLSDWLFRAIEAAEVLPISRGYFRLRRPIDRRLYELARKHCGRQPSWRIGFDLLQKKCGSKQEDKHFAAHLRELAHTNHLPDYEMRLELDHAVFTRREPANVQDMPKMERAPSPAVSAPEAGTEAWRRPVAISQRAMEQVGEVAPGWDKYALEKMYIDWAADKDPARNEDARFLGWARSFTKGRSERVAQAQFSI